MPSRHLCLVEPPPSIESRSYEVGSGKPPVASRFKPAPSGNPKGARNKVSPLNVERLKKEILQEADLTLEVNESGR
jgi:hypothetical protein